METSIDLEPYEVFDRDGKFVYSGWIFYCDPCETNHMFFLKNTQGPCWKFDPTTKTFSPSILVSSVKDNGAPNHCHVTVVNGVLNYLSDCHHGLAGQSFPIRLVEVRS